MAQVMTMDDHPMDEREAAEFLRFEESTLRRWRMLGIGPQYSKLHGGPVRYLRSELVRWIRDNSQSKPKKSRRSH